MAAFSESRLVCRAMSWMSRTAATMLAAAVRISPMARVLSRPASAP